MATKQKIDFNYFYFKKRAICKLIKKHFKIYFK